MKFFAIFAAILALAFARSRNGIYELSEAIQNPNTDPAMIPYLEAALNELMLAAMTQPAVQPAPVAEPAIDIAAIDSLMEAIYNPNTDPAMIPYLEAALSELLVSINSPINPIPVVPVPSPVAPTPVEPIVVPAPVEPIVVPAPVEEVVAAETSPLVQIIVNVNREAAAPVAPSPVVPTPVGLPSPFPLEEWVPPTRPEPEHSIVPSPVNPIDSIAVQPPQVVSPIKPPQAIVGPINPIDVVAISAPEVNPIDILQPLPVPAVSAIGVVGPLL